MRLELSAADNSSPAQALGRAQDNPYEGYDRSLKSGSARGMRTSFTAQHCTEPKS